jgi:aryl-alcohol dehydrogenase-like predicted oxidoreductase
VQQRALGRTGLRVPAVGFGAWGIGGAAGSIPAYGHTDDDVSRAVLRHAVARGVAFFDTADCYGDGHSERLLGEALAPVRDRVVLATKAGLRDAGRVHDCSPAHLRAALSGSLRRLGTDHVDVFLLHDPTPDDLRDPDVAATLRALRHDGWCRAVGASVKSPADVALAVEALGADVVEVNFSLADQRVRALGMLELCAWHGVGVIARTPLCFGFLTGAVPADAAFGAGDHRARWSPAQRRRWAEAPARFARLLAADGVAATPAQQALRFCLAYGAVSTTIPGMLTVEQVDENAAAGALPALTADVRRACEREADACEAELFLGGPATHGGARGVATAG